jgi:biopolymer transport protein ExbD
MSFSTVFTSFLSRRGYLAKLTLLLAVCLTASCASSPVSTIVRLEISNIGVYFVNGKVIEPSKLVATLKEALKSQKDSYIQVIPSAKASYEEVYFAISAVRDADGSVGVTGVRLTLE